MPSTNRRGGRIWAKDRARFLAETDEMHCWLCGGYVDRTLPGTDPWGPSADHVTPLMLGGPELVRDGAELRLSHLRCNSARSNRERRGRTLTPRVPTSRDW